MRDRGWSVAGIDPDPEAVNVAKEIHGLEARVGAVQDLLADARRYDVITLHHVLEHVHDPVATLAACRELLAPGGAVVVTTPNAGGRAHRRFGRDWLQLDVPRHLVLFTRASLRAAAGKAGFSKVSTRTTIRGARPSFAASARLRAGSLADSSAGTAKESARAMAFVAATFCCLAFDLDAGEDLVGVFRAASRPR